MSDDLTAPYIIRIFTPKHPARKNRPGHYAAEREKNRFAEAAFGKEKYSENILQETLKYFRSSADNGFIVETTKYSTLSFSGVNDINIGQMIHSPLVLGGFFVNTDPEIGYTSWEEFEKQEESNVLRRYIAEKFKTDAAIVTMQNDIIPLYEEEKENAGILTFCDGSFSPLYYRNWVAGEYGF